MRALPSFVRGALGLLAMAWLAAGCRPETPPPDQERPAPLLPSASERRLAVIVGNNLGSPGRPALRYAERDAQRMARVLAELGGFEPSDVQQLLGKSKAALEQALSRVQATARAVKARHASSRTLLLFYFSGHSDGEALELGSERLAFSALRESLRATSADVRLGILDSCKSGGVIGIKGGKKGKGFDVTLLGLPALSGEVFLSASRADELAVESQEIAGSFFTHHLVSGLRGAADADRNVRVTLEELYRHTAARTSSAAAGTLFGGQTPAYDYRLVGHGDLVLSDLRGRRQVLYLPGGFDRILVLDRHSSFAEAEAGNSTGLVLALPVGAYTLRGEREGAWYRAQAEVGEAHGQVARTVDFVRETPSAPADTRPLAEMARDFRPGNSFASPLPRSNPFFCESTDGNWKACRDGGCHVCAEMVQGFPNYFRNHPNCLPNITCEGRYFTCSANCPPPSRADSCDPEPDGWKGCVADYGCAICTLDIAAYPRYFDNHPTCLPMPGKCPDGPGPCGAACPPPGPDDR